MGSTAGLLLHRGSPGPRVPVSSWGLPLALALLLVLLAPVGPVAGQDEPRHTLILRDVPVAQALGRLAGATGMDLLYGEEVTGDRRVFCRAENQPAEEILRCIVESVDLDFYRLSSGTYVVIEAAEDAPAHGSLRGVIRDRWTGAPLPGARVALGPDRTTVRANHAGVFAMGGLLPGRHAVTVISAGYSPLQASILVPPRGVATLELALEARPLVARPIVVDGLQSARSSLSLSGSLLDGEELASGGRGVVEATSRSVLGITRRPLFADLQIQGGESGEHLVLLDGSPVLNPVSVDGLLGSLSPLALDRLTVQKAGFPARAGSATAGIVEMEHATGSSVAPTLDLDADPFGVDGRVSVPLSRGGSQGSLMVAGRTTLWNQRPVEAFQETLREWNDVDPLLTAAVLGGTPDSIESLDYRSHAQGSDLQSTDLHVAARLGNPGGSSLVASFHRGSNDLSTELLAAGHHGSDPAAARLMLARDGYRWTNHTGMLRWNRLVGARGSVGLAFRGSRHAFEAGFEMVDGHSVGLDPTTGPVQAEALLRSRLADTPPLLDGNSLDVFAVLAEGDLSIAPQHSIQLSLEAVRTRGDLRLGGLYRPTDLRREQDRLTAVVEDRITRGPLTVESGLRLTWVGGAEPVAEPRLALELEGEAGLLGSTSLRLAGGLYRQFVHQYEIANPAPSALVPFMRFWLPVSDADDAARARHLALEAVSRPALGWEFRGELYWKELQGLPAVDYTTIVAGSTAPPGDQGFLSDSRGRVTGAGVRVTRETDRLRVQAGYDRTAGTRTLPGRYDGDALPSAVDVPHRVLLLADSRLPGGISLRVRGHGVWGRDWAFRRAYYDLLTLHDDRLLPDVGRPGDRSLPPLAEVDLGIGWQGFLGNRVRAELGVDLLNVLDRQNVMDYGLRRESPAPGADYVLVPRTLSGFTPLLTARLGF